MRALLLVLLLASPALAQDAPHVEGEYGGVTPGEPARPEPAPPGAPGKARRPAPKGTLTWLGFEAKEGAAQVFFQAPGPFEVSQRVEGKTLVVHLSLTRLGTNTWRHVDTRFFDTPLASIVARASKRSKRRRARGIDVRITFKNGEPAREGALRTATEADGLYYAYLTFPGAAAAPAPN